MDLPFSPAGTWGGTGKLSKLQFQVRKSTASDWSKPVINRTRWPAAITGNKNWSINLSSQDKAKLRLGVTYKARVKVWNKNNVASAWSSVKTFTIAVDDPSITVNALDEEDDGHTPLEGLVLSGTLSVDNDVEPASIKLEIFDATSGDLKFSQMHAVTKSEADAGVWSMPYVGPDLQSREFKSTDALVILDTEQITLGSKSDPLTIPEGTKAVGIIGLGLLSEADIGGIDVTVKGPNSQWSNGSFVAAVTDITDRASDNLNYKAGGNDCIVIYLGGNDARILGPFEGQNPWATAPSKGGNILAMCGATGILASQNIPPPATELGPTGGGTSTIAGYHLGGVGETPQLVVTGVGAFGGVESIGLEAWPSFDGLYDIKVTIYDSVGGTASSTRDDGIRITRALLDDEDTTDLTTGLSNVRPTQRILIRGMKANRGPGKVIAIIEDARNIGVSRYATSPGELYFTLQSQHPQISLIEPFATHYEYQQYRRGRWVSLEYGLMVDFDAEEDEVIFYGMDYLGLLSASVEGAYQIAKSPNKSISTKHTVLKGSRYKKKTIRYIIKNQLKRARYQETHSTVKFINIGQMDKMSTKVTIFASHVERLGFIRGLIESHKGAQANGQERRTRLRVRYRPAKNDFAFELVDNRGTDKDALRLEFGGLVQGYRVVAYDQYRNKVYGIGVKPNASKPFFISKVAQGVTLADWGVWGKAELHGDIVDRKDLVRRVRASANHMSRPGKSVAIGIRVRSIDYCDGYDVLDSVPVDIVDGAIDTNNFGGGYWTIWGINYRVYDDEHDELTWILRPKGDSDSFDPDLITSEPEAISSEWAWGAGEPEP
jgi:hypothetical protein